MLALHGRDPLLGLHRLGGVDHRDEGVVEVRSLHVARRQMEHHPAYLPGALIERHLGQRHNHVLAEDPVDGVAHLAVREVAHGMQEILVVADVAHAEDAARHGVHGEDAIVGVDQDRSRAEEAQQDLVEPADGGQLGLAVERLAGWVRATALHRIVVVAPQWGRRASRDLQRAGNAAIDPPLLVHHLEDGLGGPHRLGLAEEEEALGRVQRIGEEVQDLALQIGVEVDEQVAAQDQIDARERHAAVQILLAEDHHLPDRLGHARAALGVLEEAAAELVRKITHGVVGIEAPPRERDRRLVDIGGEHLHPPFRQLGPEDIRRQEGQ